MATDFIGSIYFVQDKVWGFDRLEGGDHPGLCIAVDERALTACFLKGTSREPRSPASAFKVIPWQTETFGGRGLSRPTWFSLTPFRISLRKVMLWDQSERLAARLDDGALRDVQSRIAWLQRWNDDV